MKPYYLLLWLVIPVCAGVAYPYVKSEAELLKWLSTGLLIYALFFSVVIHDSVTVWQRTGAAIRRRNWPERLTLNPISHVSLLGTILVPLGLYLMKTDMIFGWAKPVPFNPVNLRQHPRDQVMIAVAGPLSNFTLAYMSFTAYLMIGVLFKWLYPDVAVPMMLHMFSETPMPLVPHEALWFVLFRLLSFGILLNVILGVFNLIPFPPLDGSWILKALLPKRVTVLFGKVQLAGFLLLIVALHFGLLEIFFYPAMLVLLIFQFIAGQILGF